MRFSEGTVKTKSEYLKLRDKILSSLKELNLPDGSLALKDIVVKPDNSSFNTVGPDIVINANIVSCKRPTHIPIKKSNQDYFERTTIGDVGSHRRNGIFIGNGQSFPKINSREIFDHTTFASLFLNTIGIKSTDSSTVIDYIQKYGEK